MPRHRSSRAQLRPSLFTLALLGATGAGAQSVPAGDSIQSLETVVVTARKRAEASQSVPIAISAFSGEALKRSKVTEAADLQFAIPNAQLANSETFSIRGIGAPTVGGEGGVGINLNGTGIGYLPQDEFYDLERIEVLRGPQGTLFGRNTTGGAIAIVTRRPTGTLGGTFSAELGNYNRRRVNAAFNVPASEHLRFRVAGYDLRVGRYSRKFIQKVS